MPPLSYGTPVGICYSPWPIVYAVENRPVVLTVGHALVPQGVAFRWTADT